MSGEQLIVCDDEPELRESLIEFLSSRGYQVSSANNGETLERMLAAKEPDLVVLDLRMPKKDGLTTLKSIRSRSDLPVIMLTAADDTIDRIIGLELGADDYVGKPVDPRELEARIRTVLRRRRNSDARPAQGGKESIEFQGYKLDLNGARLFNAAGAEIPLTAMEFSLLQVFAEHRGMVLTRDRLLELAHDRGWEPFDRSIDLRISRLRRKIEADATKPQLIRTIRGIGYVFDPDRTGV